eukprot:GHVQ01030560.1.p1 GENE.GHVQ01030560.1~~GHVQ01030560.1.p1  ORF type:complete len:210 (+),score=23.92 GHVQ01030560.1:498-1127(+)
MAAPPSCDPGSTPPILSNTRPARFSGCSIGKDGSTRIQGPTEQYRQAFYRRTSSTYGCFYPAATKLTDPCITATTSENSRHGKHSDSEDSRSTSCRSKVRQATDNRLQQEPRTREEGLRNSMIQGQQPSEATDARTDPAHNISNLNESVCSYESDFEGEDLCVLPRHGLNSRYTEQLAQAGMYKKYGLNTKLDSERFMEGTKDWMLKIL